MKTNKLLLIFFLISIPLLISNYKGYVSFVEQKKLLKDFNLNVRNLKLSDVVVFNTSYPNLTITTIPIKALIANYYMERGFYDKAILLLHQSRKANKYLMLSESLLADIYVRTFNKDSAYYYSKKIFGNIPNNARHFGFYLKSCINNKKYKEIIEAFNSVKNNSGSPQYWEQMSAFAYNFRNEDDVRQFSSEFFNEVKERFPENEKINLISKYYYIGEDKMKQSVAMADYAKLEFQKGNFQDAITNYKLAHEIDKYNPAIIENLIISFYENKLYNSVIKYSDSFYNNYKFSSIKVDLLYGLSLHKTGRKKKSCEFFFGIKNKNQNALGYYNKLCN